MSEASPGTPAIQNRFWLWLSQTASGLGYPTDASLARALEISPSTVLRWRSGSRPTIRHLLRISKTLGIKLEPLLVLSGHAPADAVGDAELPPPPQSVTPTERIILNADLDPHLELLMQAYWKSRIDEERKRVQRMIKLLYEDSLPITDRGFSLALEEVLESRLPAHVSRVIIDWVQYRKPLASLDRRRGAIRDSFQTILESIEEGSVVQGDDGLFYLALRTKAGAVRLDDMSFADKIDAEKALVAFLGVFKRDH
ncbi:helix-turn-helix domain-containing protein [Nonomuraea sp. NPDC026600]|uniref:helix-turn-helix domain-containing protein n=1 Tax=Nonomuraea sp. NPDC026600 TaxID=3155363 RepID=UPI0033E7FE70